MFKKILAGLGILVILLITSLIVLPIIFKDDIVQLVKDGANDNLNALVNFGDFDPVLNGVGNPRRRRIVFDDIPDLVVKGPTPRVW